MAAFEAQVLDVGPQGLGDPQSVESEERDEGVIAGAAEPGGHEERPELVAVQADGMGFHVHPRTSNMGAGRVLEQPFLLGVAVEADDRAQPAGNGGRARPFASSSRAKHSMSARRTENKASRCSLHQATNRRRSKA